jgi:hypothetical protein
MAFYNGSALAAATQNVASPLRLTPLLFLVDGHAAVATKGSGALCEWQQHLPQLQSPLRLISDVTLSHSVVQRSSLTMFLAAAGALAQ